MKTSFTLTLPAGTAILLGVLAAPVRADVLAIDLPPFVVTSVSNSTTLPTSFHLSVDQTLNISNQSTGAGAGKVVFNDLTWTQSNTNNLPYLESVSSNGAATPVYVSSSYSIGSISTPYFQLSTYNGADRNDGYAVVDHVNIASSSGAPTVSVSAVPATVVMSYSNGSGISISRGWDRVKNFEVNIPATKLNPGVNPNPTPSQTSLSPGGIFLRLAGYGNLNSTDIRGTSVVSAYQNWIQLSSAQIDPVARTATFSSGLTAAELYMFQDLASGIPMKQATIEFVAPGGAASSQWALNLAAFSNMTIDEANGGPLKFTETMKFGGYSEASFSTNPDGTTGPLQGFSYDGLKMNAGGLVLASNVTGFGNGLFAKPSTGADEGGVFVPVAAVPEPGTWALLLAGFVGLGWAARRRSA